MDAECMHGTYFAGYSSKHMTQQVHGCTLRRSGGMEGRERNSEVF